MKEINIFKIYFILYRPNQTNLDPNPPFAFCNSVLVTELQKAKEALGSRLKSDINFFFCLSIHGVIF